MSKRKAPTPIPAVTNDDDFEKRVSQLRKEVEAAHAKGKEPAWRYSIGAITRRNHAGGNDQSILPP